MENQSANICQSCSMPLSQDPKGGGSEADGSLSTEYCSYCYQDGSFVDPNLTMDQMVKNLGPMMESMKMPQDQIEQVKSSLPNLKRWKSS